MSKIKICGVTNTDDANLVASLGADYVGINMCETSPRKVSLKMAKDIVSKLPSFVQAAGVFCNMPEDELVKLVKKCPFKLLQFHGDETPEYCRSIKEKTGLIVIKAFKMKDESTIDDIKRFIDSIDYILLDAYVPGQDGGTGEVFNWDLALKVNDLGKKVFLAGGLNPDNVKEAIEKVNPFCVDTASGVERLQRRKDYDKLMAFIRGARGL